MLLVGTTWWWLIKAVANILGEEVIVPKYNNVMGALGAALLVQKNLPKKKQNFGDLRFQIRI